MRTTMNIIDNKFWMQDTVPVIDNKCSREEFDRLQTTVAILQAGLIDLKNYHQQQLEELQKQIDYLKLPWWKKIQIRFR